MDNLLMLKQTRSRSKDRFPGMHKKNKQTNNKRENDLMTCYLARLGERNICIIFSIHDWCIKVSIALNSS